MGRMVAEWMIGGEPELDPNEVDIARFYPYGRTKSHIGGRSSEGYNKIYGIVHPREQWQSSRNVRLSPFYAREKELGAVFFETAGWERPHWYESNGKLLEEYGERVQNRPNEWDARWWSPIINAEHLAMRDRVGMVDLSAFAVFDVAGAGSARLYSEVDCCPDGGSAGQSRVHTTAQPFRRVEVRFDDHANDGDFFPNCYRRKPRGY